MQLQDTTLKTVGVAGIDEWIVANEIRVDMQYQRPINIAHVRKIANEFDERAFGVILVSERADGSVYVIDGQHRLAAVKSMGRGGSEIPCHVYRGLAVGDEALIFHMQTQRKQIAPIDRFKARLFAGDEQAMAIDRILRKHDLQVGNTGNGNIQAIAKIEEIYIKGGADRLENVLDLIMAGIGDEDRAPSATLLAGVHIFLSRYESLYNRARLIQTIRLAGPDKIQRNTESVKTLMGSHISVACGRVLLALYNAKLQTRRLPEWDSVSPADAGNITRKAKAAKKADEATT